MEMLLSFAPIILLFALYYFMLIRPQKRKQQEITSMRDTLEIGDEVVTIGGFVGKIVNVKEETVTIEIGTDKARLAIMRWGISNKVETENDF